MDCENHARLTRMGDGRGGGGVIHIDWYIIMAITYINHINKYIPVCQLYASFGVICYAFYIPLYIVKHATKNTAMTDLPQMRFNCCSNVVMALHFYTFVPPMRDHQSYKTTLCGPVGWSLDTSSMYR